MNNPLRRIDNEPLTLDGGFESTKLLEVNKDKDILNILGIKSKLNNFTQMRNKIVNQKISVINNSEVIDILNERTKNLTVFQIKRLTNEQVEEIYTINGEKVILSIEMDNEEKKISFMREYLIFNKESSEALRQIDKSIETFEKELKKDEDELNKVINEYGDVQTLIKNHLIDNINKSTDENIKNRNIKILDNFNDASTLNIIYEHYKNQKVLNTLHDYKIRAEGIYKNYVKTCKQLSIKSDITIFENLEMKFLPQKYHKYPNLFLFAIIRYFAYKKDDCNKYSDGIFLSQFIVNVQNLFCDKFKDSEEKQLFINSIMKVLDLFY